MIYLRNALKRLLGFLLLSAVGACVKAAGQQSAVKPAHSKCEPPQMSKVQGCALARIPGAPLGIYFLMWSNTGIFRSKSQESLNISSFDSDSLYLPLLLSRNRF